MFWSQMQTNQYTHQNHLMLGGYYRQTFSQTDRKSLLQQMVQLILVGFRKKTNRLQIFQVNNKVNVWLIKLQILACNPV